MAEFLRRPGKILGDAVYAAHGGKDPDIIPHPGFSVFPEEASMAITTASTRN